MNRKLVVGLVAAVAAGSLAIAAPSSAGERKKPLTFKASGSLLAPSPIDLFGQGITRTEFTTACAVPATQGLDGYVIELPKKMTLVDSTVYTEATGLVGLNLLDLFFFSEDCTEMGDFLGSDEGVPVIPQGTKYVLVTNWFGEPETTFDFYATEAR